MTASTLRYVNITDILISPDRQRKTFEQVSIDLLAEDIARPHGLLNPIVLANDQLTLVTGERRLRAISQLHAKGTPFTYQGKPVPRYEVPYTRLSDLTPDQLYEAELSENIHREQLSWQEEVQAKAALAKLRFAEGKTKTEVVAEIRQTSPEDVPAKAIITEVLDPIRLAENLHRPSVAKASSQKEALKNLDRELRREHLTKIAEAGILTSPNESRYQFFHKPFTELLADETYSDLLFDCAICDPPYGIEAHTFASGVSDGKHGYDDSYSAAITLYRSLATVLRERMAPLSHAYVFFDIRYYHEIYSLFSRGLAPRLDYSIWPRPLIWSKGTVGNCPDPRFCPRNSYDAILFIRFGDKEVNFVGNDVISVSQPPDPKLHMATKPTELYHELLRRSTRPGHLVLDPCAGSGTIFRAAALAKCRAVGFDIDPVSSGLCLETITSLEDQQ